MPCMCWYTPPELKLSGGDNLHLLLDSELDPRCPWCGSESIKICHEKQRFSHEIMPTLDKINLYVRCQNCLARGPVLNVLEQAFDKNLGDCTSFLMGRWRTRVKKSIELPKENDDDKEKIL